MPIRFSYKEKTPCGPTPMRAMTEKRVHEWRDKIMHEQLDPWCGRGEHGGMQVDVKMRSGKPIHLWGSTFNGAPRQVFWSDDFIPPFLDDAIEDVLQETAKTCREHGLPPDDYLREAAGFLWGLVHTVYDRMAEMEECADHRAHPRRDVSEYVDKMLARIEDHVKAARLLAEPIKKLNQAGQVAEAMGKNKVQLTDTEQNILDALGDKHLTGPALLKKAGYDYSSHYRAILSQLVKRGILGNDHSGYFRR